MTIVNYIGEFQLETVQAIKTGDPTEYNRVRQEFTDYLYSLTRNDN